METTCQKVIDRALRRIGRMGGTETATGTEADQAFDALKGFYQRLVIEGVSGPLRDVFVENVAIYNANENERIVVDSNVTPTVNLPLTVSSCLDYIGDYGEGRYFPTTSPDKRLPRDLSVVSITDISQLLTEDFIYDGSRKQWMSITTLALTDEAPLSHRDPVGLSACLSIELAAEYGLPLDVATVLLAQRYRNTLTVNFSQGGEAVTPASYF